MTADATAPALPDRMRRLPLDRHHRPVPWFVHWDDDGTPDFRVVGAGRLRDAIRFGLCWVCGTPRGRHAAFVIGPMCAINRVSAEPPSHLDCATYSAKACPFLATPHMRRRTSGLDADLQHATAGVAIERNPGVALVWSSKTWQIRAVDAYDRADAPTAGLLWDVGDPTAVSWWCQGRHATRDEVQQAIDTGLPLLRAECDREPPAVRAVAHAELDYQLDRALKLLPAE